MIRRMMIAVLAVVSMLGANGCRSSCCRPGAPPNPFLPPPPGASTIPPTAIPVAPGGGAAFPPRSGSLPPPDPLLGGPPSSSFAPPPPSTSAKPPAEILLPDPIPQSSGMSRAQAPTEARKILGEPTNPKPQSTEPPYAPPATPANGYLPPADTSRAAKKPPVQAMRFPGLAGLVVVKAGVASGRKPTPEGLDLLKKSGYRSIVYLQGEGADTAGLQAAVEKRGLKFVAIETTPAHLTAASDDFNRTIATPASRPVYICDDDGLRTGVLWYVYFRSVEILNADAADIRARPLGYSDQGDEARTFQVAVQRYLESR